MAYTQHLVISLTLLQDCLDCLFAEVLPRQCPPSPSKHWYCCLWEVMVLVWLRSVHACFLNSITNLFAMSVSFQRPHAKKSHSREVYDLGWHYCPVQLHTEIRVHNRQRWIGTSELIFRWFIPIVCTIISIKIWYYISQTQQLFTIIMWNVRYMTTCFGPFLF